MPAARRCSKCSIDWPDDYARYQRCPKCEGQTVYTSNGDPLGGIEAEVLAHHIEFERKYPEGEPFPVWPEIAAETREALERVERMVEEVRWLRSIPVDGDPIPVDPLPAYQFGKDAWMLDRRHPMDRDDG